MSCLDEGDGELHTLADIYKKMVELSEGTECYHRKYLKTKLIDHYKEHIYVFESDGWNDILILIFYGRIHEKEKPNIERQ